MKNLKNNKMLLGIGIAFILLATLSMSYAWFSATVTTNNSHDQVVKTGTLELTYTDGKEIVMNNIRPGATLTKEVSVKNTGTLDAEYNLVWQELINQIQNDEMVMTIACERQTAEGVKQENCEGLDSETPISKPVILKQIGIEAGITHKYTITITFKETNSDQNYNQGKNFTGTIGVNEYKEPTPVYCTTDQELTQGAEYTDGTYTYRYMQEMNADEGTWKNITNDGWGVKLANTESTDIITKAPCVYINDKPIVSMSYAFADSKSKGLDMSDFNTSNVINMEGMFGYSQMTTLYLGSINTSKVTTMSQMFYGSKASSLDLSSFDTSNVTRMDGMFYDSKATEIKGLEKFNTSKVTNMSSMFDSVKVTSLDVSSFDTSEVTDTSNMFASLQIEEIKGLDKLNTSKVIDMQYMFHGVHIPTLTLTNFNTSNVTNMDFMFSLSETKIIDVSSFDTSKVTSMWGMFSSSYITTIYASESFNVTNVSDAGIFIESYNLKGGAGTVWKSSNPDDKTYAHIDGGTANPGYFTLKTN